MKTKLILTIVASLVTTALYAFAPPPVGSAAPAFSLTDAKGKTHSLAQYKGKYVVLEWFNPECPFVKKHYGSGNMQKLQEEYTSKVTTGWKTQQTALLLDPEGKAGRAYGAKNTPNMVVINPEGKVVYEGAIDSKATPNPADIPNSTNYVKVALDESLAGKPVTTSTTKPYGCSVKYK